MTVINFNFFPKLLASFKDKSGIQDSIEAHTLVSYK